MNNALIITNLSMGSVREGSPVCCEDFYQVAENIIHASKHFDFCFVVNDEHSSSDREFIYMPPHMSKSGYDIVRFPHIENKIRSKSLQYLKKQKFSAISSVHNRKIILEPHFDRVCVSGFSGCIDILPTCLDLIQSGQNIFIIPECIGDVSSHHFDRAISYLTYMGVSIEAKKD